MVVRSGRVPAAVHGSWSGYAAWKCRCEPCLGAGRAYRAARKAGLPNPVPSAGKPKRDRTPAPRLDGPVKRFRYRIHPSAQAEARLRRVMGGVRFAYNAYIALAHDSYASGSKHPSGFDGCKLIVTEGRRAVETAWMWDLPAQVLSAAVMQAAGAYQNFFDSAAGRRKGARVGFPRFKKRGHRQSAYFHGHGFSIPGGHQATSTAPGARLRLAKVGTLRVNWHRPLPGPPSSVTIIREADGTWWASFVVATAQPAPVTPTRGPRAAGVDLGLTDFASMVYSDGSREKIPNPRHGRTAARRLKAAQKAYSRTKPGSRNREKQRVKVARMHSRVVNQRTNHARQVAARLTRENQAVAVETLNIRAMGRGRLARSVHDAGWGLFLNHLTEAAQKRGTHLTAVPAGFPSTRVCSGCGVNGGPKPLHVRVWECTHCGAVLDRDYNAAVNIMVAAGPAETVNACGGSVRRRLAGATAYEAGTRPTPTNTGRVEGSRARGRATAEAIHEHTRKTHPAVHTWNEHGDNLETGRHHTPDTPTPARAKAIS